MSEGSRVDIPIETKTEVLAEALPYFQRFRDSIFVVKFGGSFMDTEQARVGVATDLVFLATVGIQVIVVHGGGPAINQAMSEAKIQPVWRNGLRVTDAATVGIVEQTLNGVTNADICANLKRVGGKPFGIRGQDVFTCSQLRPLDEKGEPQDIGFVGNIHAMDASMFAPYLAGDYIPVVSPLARDSDGQIYNINADAAAAFLAASIGARRLVYLCDVPGLLRNPKDPASLISSVSKGEVPELKRLGIIGSGMLPKVESAIEAMDNGVHRVHFIDGRMPHSLLLEIFTDKGVGTEIIPAKSGIL